MKKIIALFAALVLTLSLFSVAFAEIKSSYNLSSVEYIDAMGWYWTRDESLILRDDTHYELYHREYAFGTTDPGLKANQLIVYRGTYSITESADGEACHFDITLDTMDGIYFEQHGKGYGYGELGYAMVLDTDNWTEIMDEIVYPDGTDDGAAQFLANHNIAGIVITVEDLREDLDDVTLENKIVTLPENVVFTINKG
jgi:hypothetical protein